MICVDLLTHLTYTLYRINVLQEFPLVLKAKAAGMSNASYAQYQTQDLIEHNSTVQRIVKHDFSKNVLGLLFFSKTFQAWKLLF